MNTKNKHFFKFTIIITTLILTAICVFELFDYMITYKYHIEENFDHKDIVLSYEGRKTEIVLIMIYLKVFIVYLLTISSYFIYKIFSKKINSY